MTVTALLGATVAVAFVVAAAVPAGAAPIGTSQIALGANFSCAITTAGGLRCWGENRYGSTGNGNADQRVLAPTAVSGMSSGVTSVAAGWEHACAVQSGAVKCWGYGVDGQVGNGSNQYTNSSPQLVTGLTSGATSVGASYADSCAVVGGAVKCWGDNTYGQLGNGTTTKSNTPVAVSTLTSGVVSVAVGSAATCALTSAGAVWCWGYSGHLGTGATSNATTPVAVPSLASGVTAIAAGSSHFCALTSGGAMRCWGGNTDGEIGDGTTTTASTPVTVTGLSSGVASIGPGYTSSCAVLTTGAAKCWGSNRYGQLGDGTTTNSLTPIGVSGLTSGVAAIAAKGQQHACALMTDGRVKCWGQNFFDDTGNLLTEGQLGHLAAPLRELSSGVAAVAVGSNSCALTTAGGVKCWGPNDSMALGTGSASPAYSRTPLDVTGLTSGVASISVSYYTGCAVTTAGAAQCWGANFSGQVGNGSTSNVGTAPGPVSGLASGVASISTGGNSTCAVTTAGAVLCWGSNTAGRLGNGTTTNSSVPVAVSGLSSGVASVSVGYDSACALTTAGGVLCWGLNSSGQLGNGTFTNSSVPVAVTGLSSGVTSLGVGDDRACVVVGGGVKCWGRNPLGNGTTNTSNTPITPTGLASGYAQVSVGDLYTSCGRTSAGAVTCWGWNYNGETGNTAAGNDANNYMALAPAAVTNVSGVAQIDTGYGNTCALTTGGGVLCWGEDWTGRNGTANLYPNDVEGGAIFAAPAPGLSITGTRTPAANANGWNNTTVTVSFTCAGGTAPITCPSPTVVGEGAGQSVTGNATDAAGGAASTTVSGINVDVTAPSLVGTPTTSPNAAGWYNHDVGIRWTCADALSGVVACPTDSTISGEGASLSTSTTVGDRALNLTTASSSTVKIDQTPPVTGISAVADWSNTAVTLTLSPSDGLSGLAATFSKIDGGSPQGGLSPHISGDGTHSLEYWSVDQAGNIEASHTVTVKIDGTPPTIAGTAAPGPNTHGWNNTDVNVSWLCGDGTGSGVASCAAPQTVTSEGSAQDVTGSAADIAGNTTVGHVSVSIDKTRPTIAAQTPPVPSSGWFTAPVPASFSCNDPGPSASGIATCTDGATITGDGAHRTLAGSAVDNAGNSASATADVAIDATAPSISGAPTTAPGPGGWYPGSVTIHWTCADATSGVNACPADDVVSVPGTTTVSHQITDIAGNPSTVASVTVNVDTGQSTAIQGTISPPLNSAGWAKTAVTVHFSCGAVSGVASCPPDQVLSAEGAGQQVVGTVVDNAGNTASTTVTANIDLTSPVVSVTGVADGATYVAGSVPVAGCTTGDPLSGVATAATLDVSGGTPAGVGAYRATCSGASDNAGNTRSTSAGYTVIANTGVVTGTISLTTGGAVAGSDVRLYTSKSTASTLVATTTTDSAGHYTFPSAPPGTFAVFAGKSGATYGAFATNLVTVTAGSFATSDIALQPGASGSATVSGPTGAVVGATVRVMSGGNPTATRVLTDASGHYTLTGLVAGTYTVQGTAFGYQVATSPPFTVATGSSAVPSPDVTLTPAASTAGLTGSLVNAAGAPIAGANVRLWLVGDASTKEVRSTTTNAAGAWSIGAVPAGTYNVQVAAAGIGSAYYPTSITLTGGTTASQLAARLTTGPPAVTGTYTPGS